ncbi:hypothetical protein AA18889_0022 [Acetobacter senegalensis DSM 18889]|nr:hypothetical protein AA18889_0022 [Acetobacter senegalensis DSM 18889]
MRLLIIPVCIKSYSLHPVMLLADMQVAVGTLLQGVIGPGIMVGTLSSALLTPNLHLK